MEINKCYKSLFLPVRDLLAPWLTCFITNDTLLTTSFIDNNEPKEFSYMTKSLSVSWPLVEIRNIFKLNAFFLCRRRQHTQLGDLNSVHQANLCLSENGGWGLKDNVCTRKWRTSHGITYPKKRKTWFTFGPNMDQGQWLERRGL